MLQAIKPKTRSVAQMRMEMVGQTSTTPSRMKPRNIPMKTATALETLLMDIKGTTASVFQVHQQRTFLGVRIWTVMDGRI